MQIPSLEELASQGVHFGHRSSRWNPGMEPFIFAQRNSIHLINLEMTQEYLRKALEYLQDVASRDGKVLFIGTKRQARELVKAAAQSAGMPFVVARWLGGTFTNFNTIQKTVKKLEKLHKTVSSPDSGQKFTKKELLTMEREIGKLENFFEGIKDMKRLPEAIFVVDVNHEKIAVREARKTGVKIVGIVDTNSDPKSIDYVIPANDDAIKSIALLVNLVSSAIVEGKQPAPRTQEGEENTDKGKEKGDEVDDKKD